MTRSSRRCHGAAPGILLVLAALLCPQAAWAQLYSWQEVEGNVVIKSAPPPWYKPGERSRGPRVQVLRDGKVIDDTAWPLEKRQQGQTPAAPQEPGSVQAGVQGTPPPKLPEGQLPALLRQLPPEILKQLPPEILKQLPPDARPGAATGSLLDTEKDSPPIGQAPTDLKQ